MTQAGAMNKFFLLLAPIISLTVGVLGVLALGWDWRQLIVLYWLYNITFGLAALIDIAKSNLRFEFASDSSSSALPVPESSYLFIKIGAAGFFCMHYGMFTLVHGFFVFSIINGELLGQASGAPINIGPILAGWAVVLLVSLIAKITTAEVQKDIVTAMLNPYKRIVVLHLTIIFGAALIGLTGLPAAAALLLVGLSAIFEFIYLRKDFTRKQAVLSSPVQQGVAVDSVTPDSQ